MAIIYYYIEKNKLEETLSKGIEVSKVDSHQIIINGDTVPCIIGFLCPRDDVSKYGMLDYVCLELDVETKKMYVLNGDLDSINNGAYLGSSIPIENYKFGTYRRPEIAVITDVLSNKIMVSSKIIGNPILFESSNKLYKDSVMEELRLKYNDFDETLLGIFFMLMVSKGRMKLLGQKKYGIKMVYIYEDNASGNIYTIGIQEGNG